MSDTIDNKAASDRNFGHALPGAISWGVVGLCVLGTILFPRVWLAIATVFIAYFIVRMVITVTFSMMGERKIIDWGKRTFTVGEDRVGPFGFAPSDVRHIVVIPNYKEPDDILRRTLDGLAAQHRANERVVAVLGMEEREQGAREKGLALAAEYAEKLLDVVVTVHPGNIPGEEPGKSSNEAWAARESYNILRERGLTPELTTITSCDADSVLHPKYFSAVSAFFAHDESRHLRFWQAPLFYYNNIWQVPAPIRFTTWLSHAVQVAELAMPFFDPLPISTYTLSVQLAERCGWWDPGVIPEDWHEYLNCMFESGEEIQTTSIFLPTMADATDGEGWRQALSNRFHQVKRHAWGAEDVGYIYGQLTRRPSTLRKSTVFRFTQVLHDHVMRVASWFFLVSVYILSAYYTKMHWYDLNFHYAIVQNLIVLRVLLTTGGLIMISSIIFELWRCPPPEGVSKLRTGLEIFGLWFTLPLLGFYLGTLPALQAQTQLMFNIPIGYRVTPKFFADAPVQKASS